MLYSALFLASVFIYSASGDAKQSGGNPNAVYLAQQHDHDRSETGGLEQVAPMTDALREETSQNSLRAETNGADVDLGAFSWDPETETDNALDSYNADDTTYQGGNDLPIQEEALDDDALESCPSAFGFAGNAKSRCFLDESFAGDSANNWGWSIDISDESSVSGDLIANGLNCDHASGHTIGSFTVQKNKCDVTLKVNMLAGTSVDAIHVHVAKDPFVDMNGLKSVFPHAYDHHFQFHDHGDDLVWSQTFKGDCDAQYVLFHANACTYSRYRRPVREDALDRIEAKASADDNGDYYEPGYGRDDDGGDEPVRDDALDRIQTNADAEDGEEGYEPEVPNDGEGGENPDTAMAAMNYIPEVADDGMGEDNTDADLQAEFVRSETGKAAMEYAPPMKFNLDETATDALNAMNFDESETETLDENALKSETNGENANQYGDDNLDETLSENEAVIVPEALEKFDVCPSAFAYGGSSVSTCFNELKGLDLSKKQSRGWAIDISSGEHIGGDVLANAHECNLDQGEVVGSFFVQKVGCDVTIDLKMADDSYSVDSIQFHLDSDPVPLMGGVPSVFPNAFKHVIDMNGQSGAVLSHTFQDECNSNYLIMSVQTCGIKSVADESLTNVKTWNGVAVAMHSARNAFAQNRSSKHIKTALIWVLSVIACAYLVSVIRHECNRFCLQVTKQPEYGERAPLLTGIRQSRGQAVRNYYSV